MLQSIAILYGGDSAEREVSLESGMAVADALARLGHDTTLIDTRDVPVNCIDWSGFDTAFIALHGTYGEDGGVQADLARLRVPYTGSGIEASRCAFDKLATKAKFAKTGIPTPAYEPIDADEPIEAVCAKAEAIGYPLVIKPARQGSSVGVSIVAEPGQLAAAVELCFQHDTKGLIEKAIIGEEWTVGMINYRCLHPIRIESATEFYDYAAKYQDNRTQYHIANVQTDYKLIDRLQDISRDACANVETSGVARVDFRVDESGQPWVLEINTVPGFTSHSLVPKAAKASGISFPELCRMALMTAVLDQPPVVQSQPERRRAG